MENAAPFSEPLACVLMANSPVRKLASGTSGAVTEAPTVPKGEARVCEAAQDLVDAWTTGECTPPLFGKKSQHHLGLIAPGDQGGPSAVARAIPLL